MDTEYTQSRSQVSAGKGQQRVRSESMPTAESKAQSVSEEISRENQPHNPVVTQLQRQVANAYMLRRTISITIGTLTALCFVIFIYCSTNLPTRF